MRRKLLSAVASVFLLVGTLRPAQAVFGIGDIVFDPSNFAELETEVQNGLTEIKNLEQIYTNARQQLQELEAFYNLFAHITNVAQLAAVLNSNFIKSPMLADALQLEQAFRGLGLNTTLAGKIRAIINRVQYYAPQGNDFAAKHLNDQATATAGQLASAEDAYTAENTRIDGLKQLQAEISTDDPKKIADLQVRATLEAATAIAENNKLVAAQMIQQAQRDAVRQQSEQGFRYSVDQMAQQAQAALNAANGGAVNLVQR